MTNLESIAERALARLHRITLRPSDEYYAHRPSGIVPVSELRCRDCGGTVLLHANVFANVEQDDDAGNRVARPATMYYASCANRCGRVTGWKASAASALRGMRCGRPPAEKSGDPYQ